MNQNFYEENLKDVLNKYGRDIVEDAKNGKIYVYLIQIGNKKHPKGGDSVFGKFIWAAY